MTFACQQVQYIDADHAFHVIYQQNLFVLCGDDPQHSVMPKKLSDRFKTNQSKPPLVEIGGMRAKDGWVAISETGLVRCFFVCILFSHFHYTVLCYLIVNNSPTTPTPPPPKKKGFQLN